MWIREFTLLTLYILPGEATLSAWMAPLLLVARLVCYTTGVAAGIAKYGNSTLDMEVGKLNTTLDMEIEEAPTKEAEDFSVVKKITPLGQSWWGFTFWPCLCADCDGVCRCAEPQIPNDHLHLQISYV